MRRFAIMGSALLAMLAVYAVAAGSASATKLDLTWNFEENQVETGNEFDLYSEEVTFKTDVGNVTCSGNPIDEYGRLTQGIAGIDQTNDLATDKIQLNNAFGTLFGGKECVSTTPFGTGAYAYIYGPSPLGILSLAAKEGKATFKVKNIAEPADVALFYTGGADCYYSFTTLKGKMNATTALERDETKFVNQKLKFNKAASTLGCPATVTVTAPFIYSLSNTVYYIFEHTVA